MTLNPFAALVESGPMLVDNQSQNWLAACIANAGAVPKLDELMADQNDGFWYPQDDWRAAFRPYTVKDGILLLPVKGMLLHNFSWQLGPWATGYDYIWRAYERGMDDPEVKGIALLVHSPGGLVAGNQVLVDKMAARRDEKPVRGFAQETACSAAYNIIAVAPHIAMSPTGTVGSIGVYTMHIDWSAANDRRGIKVTYISAGDGKTDGNPDEALSDEALARIQARVDELYSVFVASVARNRAELTDETIRGTLKAHTYSASQAVSNGLADSVGSQDDALSAFAGFLDDLSDNEGDEEMSTPDTTAVAQAAHEEAVATARTEAAAAATVRIGAILNHEEATDRGALANHIAFNTDLTVEAAAAMLAASPKAVATVVVPPVVATTPNHLADAMKTDTTGDVGAGEGGEGKQADPNSAAADIALAASFGLKGFAKPAAAN